MSAIKSNVVVEDHVVPIDKEAERKLLRKIDRNILPWICVAYLLNYLDRSNVSRRQGGKKREELLTG